MFKNPDLARTFRTIAEQGPQAFYGGEIGRAIVSFAQKNGGLLSLDDLKAHRVDWVEPVSSTYRGHKVLELPQTARAWWRLRC